MLSHYVGIKGINGNLYLNPVHEGSEIITVETVEKTSPFYRLGDANALIVDHFNSPLRQQDILYFRVILSYSGPFFEL